MFDKSIIVDKKTYDDAKKILDEIGLSVNDVTKIMLKKVARDGNIAFLLGNSQSLTTNHANTTISSVDKMTKNRAISLFRNEGISFDSNVTFSSKNKSTRNYWSNPSFDLLKEDWALILNDNINNKLHLLYIPKNSIAPHSLVSRGDNKHVIDLQILGDDIFFTDMRSKYSFSKFLKKTIDY
ncbi:MAG: type II toxin-antitoxin system RelB/DinJ family antitoxin [Oscillospiraceae bacterium]|nr:type II toxin-antitoxin system RelB/DinJ family antitoxin [Oscillospiraceae bacterium]